MKVTVTITVAGSMASSDDFTFKPLTGYGGMDLARETHLINVGRMFVRLASRANCCSGSFPILGLRIQSLDDKLYSISLPLLLGLARLKKLHRKTSPEQLEIASCVDITIAPPLSFFFKEFGSV